METATLELRASTQKTFGKSFEQMVAESPEAVMICAGTRVVFITENAGKLFGRDPESMIGGSCPIFSTGCDITDGVPKAVGYNREGKRIGLWARAVPIKWEGNDAFLVTVSRLRRRWEDHG